MANRGKHSVSLSPKILAYVGIIVSPVVLTFGILLREMRGIPMFDDYQALIFFGVKFQQLHGFLPKLLFAIAAQHDEYKLIFEHLIVELQLVLSPHIHYELLVVLGNLFVVATLAVYWFGYFADLPPERRILRFAPISLLLVQLNYAETLDWAMSGLQMMPVISFSLLSLLLLSTRHDRRPKLCLVFSCLAACLASLSSANGFVLAPLGLLLLWQQRRFRAMVAWLVPFACASAAYLYRYERLQQQMIVAYPTMFQKALFFVSFSGAAVENMHHFPVPGASIALGIILVGCFLYALLSGYARAHPFAFYAALWALVCAAGVTQLRIKMGLDLSLTGRYKTYSDLLLIFAYGFVVHRVDASAAIRTRSQPRLLYVSALGFSIVLNLASAWFGYQFLKRRADVSAEGFRRYLADPEHVSPEISLNGEPITTTEPEFCRQIMNEAIRTGTFRVPIDYR